MSSRDIPRIITHHALFVVGEGYAGRLAEQVLPVVSRTGKDYRPAGLSAPTKLYTGFEKMESSYKLDEYDPYVLKLMRDGFSIRLESRASGKNKFITQAIHATVGGTIGKVDMGSWGSGDDIGAQLSFTVDVDFYQLRIDGEEIYYIDVLNNVVRIGGIDENTITRANLNF